MNRSRAQGWIRIARLGFLVLVASILTLSLSACQGPAERIWLKTPEWSRGLLIGSTQSTDAVQPTPLGDGRIVFPLLTRNGSNSEVLSLVVFEEDGTLAWSRSYEDLQGRLGSPRIVLGEQGLYLLWLDLSGEALYWTVVDSRQGDVLQLPKLLSREDRVGNYDIAINPQGEPVVWYAGPRRAPGLIEVTFAGNDLLYSRVDPMGVRPDIQFDRDGRLVALWAHYPLGFDEISFYYSIYPSGRFDRVNATQIASPGVAQTAVLEGPLLGLSADQAYAFWTIINRTGLAAGTAQSTFVQFPIENPETNRPHLTLLIPTGYDLPYEQLDPGGLGLEQRVVLPARDLGRTSFLTELADAEIGGDELLLVFNARVDYLLRKTEMQIGSLVFQHGAPASYELISFTPRASLRPAVVGDSQGYLHLTWVERGGGQGFQVYYTSTNPEMVEALADVTTDDLSRLAADMAFGMATGALLAPVAIGIWVVGPIILLAVTFFLRGEDERLFEPGTLLTLAAAIAFFWAMKPTLIAGIGTYLPFSAWIPIIPSWMERPLILGVPFLIGLFGLAVAWFFTYRIERRLPMIFFLIYAAVDGILTTALYGAQFYGAA